MALHNHEPRVAGTVMDPHDLGWRLRVLRTRRNLTLGELSSRAGLDISYLSRLERDALQNARAKPGTIDRVLRALEATNEEIDAIYHHERPALTRTEVRQEVKALRSIELTSEPTVLRDERWFVWYYNRAARAALGLRSDEYARCIGVHMLHEVMDPGTPRYYRVPDNTREEFFSLRAKMFQISFAHEEFDAWYRAVVERIHDFSWAWRLWEHPLISTEPLVIERQDMTIANPIIGEITVSVQLNRLMANPRFLLATWTPQNAEARNRLAALSRLPDFDYDVLDYTPGDG